MYLSISAYLSPRPVIDDPPTAKGAVLSLLAAYSSLLSSVIIRKDTSSSVNEHRQR